MLNIPQLLIVILLYFILFFGIGFILNMLLRSTWAMTIIYPIIVILIVDSLGITAYFTRPKEAISVFMNHFASLQVADMIVLLAGLVGAIFSGFASKLLRKKGYQMF